MVDGIPEPESVTTWNFDGSYPVPMLNFVQAKDFSRSRYRKWCHKRMLNSEISHQWNSQPNFVTFPKTIDVECLCGRYGLDNHGGTFVGQVKVLFGETANKTLEM